MTKSYENGETNLGFQEMGQENLVQEIEVKREKKPRRRGRGKKKEDGIEKDSTFRGINDFGYEGIQKDSILMDVDFGNVPREGVVCYTRKELGEMRFVGEEEQRKKWIEVYCGLGPEVAEEYDSLIGCKNRKQQISVEFDPRNRGDKDFDNKLSNGESADTDTSTSVHNQNGHPIAEEQYCDDEESDEEYDTILRPAFFVSGEPDFDSGPPQDGLEYLRRVRYEAAQIPKVKVVKVDKSKVMSEQTAYMPQIPEIAKCPDHLLPLKSWDDTFLSDFSQLRQALLRDGNSTDEWNGEKPSIFASDGADIAPELSSDCIVETFEELTAGGEDDIHSSDTRSVDHPFLPSHGSDTPDAIESSTFKQIVKGQQWKPPHPIYHIKHGACSSSFNAEEAHKVCGEHELLLQRRLFVDIYFMCLDRYSIGCCNQCIIAVVAPQVC